MREKNLQGWRILSDIPFLTPLCDKYETENYFLNKRNKKTNTVGRCSFSRSTKWYIHYNFWVCFLESDRSNTCMHMWHTRILTFFWREIVLKKPTGTSIALWLKTALRCALSIGMVLRKNRTAQIFLFAEYCGKWPFSGALFDFPHLETHSNFTFIAKSMRYSESASKTALYSIFFEEKCFFHLIHPCGGRGINRKKKSLWGTTALFLIENSSQWKIWNIGQFSMLILNIASIWL